MFCRRIIDKYNKKMKIGKCPQCGYCFSKNSQKRKLIYSWNKSISLNDKCSNCGIRLKVKYNSISKIVLGVLAVLYIIPLFLVLNKYISHCVFEIISILYVLLIGAFDMLYALPTAKIVLKDE